MTPIDRIVPLDEFILEKQKDFPYATGELSGLLRDIGMAAKIINRDVNRAGLVDIMGNTGTTNIQGEEVRKLDDIANQIFIHSLKTSGECCGIASEEEDSFVAFSPEGRNANAKYVVLFDPLDGSSNIDVCVSIGTIFSIYRRISPVGQACTIDDFLQPGHKQVAAGYVLYGSSTILVYTTGSGVNGFTLDPSIGEFCLSHPNIKTPETGKTYSINQGSLLQYNHRVQEYVAECMGANGSKPLSLRYIGSMVADFHRNLLKGGIFIYPDSKSATNGKLRLMYECNPLAFVQEQAGGAAYCDMKRIMDIQPKELHQRTPIYIGSKQMVAAATR
jgi:fructose-1,6-bisphosphatase I